MFTPWGYMSTLLLDIKVDTHEGNYNEGLAPWKTVHRGPAGCRD